MNIETRRVTDNNRDECIYVEKGSMPHNRYIDDVWNMFLYETKGDLIGAFVDGKLQGMGKLTVLYNDYGWLETLRVHPDFQNMGLGQEMYNKISKHLAEKNRFKVSAEYTEILKPVEDSDYKNDDFIKVNSLKGEEILSKYYDEMDKYIVINRTFFPVDKGLGKFLASKGWLYTDGKGSIIVCGYRFQPEKAFHIPFVKGDIKKALNFANYLGKKAGSKNLSILKPVNSKEIEIFIKEGFKIDDDYMTLWMDFRR